MKRYKHRSLSKSTIYRQVYVLIQKPDLLLVYWVLATTVYLIMTDLYHDISPVYHIFQQRHISIAGYPNLRYTHVYVLTQNSRYAVYRCISHYCIFYHDRPLS